MKKVINTITDYIALLACIDVLIVFIAIMQIADGQAVPHLAFWDAQIKFVAHILGA